MAVKPAPPNKLSPQQRHNGKDTALLAQRQAILEQAKLRNSSRWGTRPVINCEPIGPVTLNPEKEMKMRNCPVKSSFQVANKI